MGTLRANSSCKSKIQMAATLSTSNVVVAKQSFAPQSAKVSQAKFGCTVKGLAGARPLRMTRKAPQTVAMAGAPAMVPDMDKRNTMNLLLVGALGLPGLSLAGGYAFFFVPPGGGGAGGGQSAKDANGDDVKVTNWLSN